MSKYGSGLMNRDPHTAGLIVHACAYLHNLAIDLGLAKITRESQRDPDFEPLLRQNAIVFLMNAIKRNADLQYHCRYRPVNKIQYLAGMAKRNQLLREQFGDRSIRLGRVTKKKRGRPVGGGNPRSQEVRQAAAAGRGRGRGRPRKEPAAAEGCAPRPPTSCVDVHKC